MSYVDGAAGAATTAADGFEAKRKPTNPKIRITIPITSHQYHSRLKSFGAPSGGGGATGAGERLPGCREMPAARAQLTILFVKSFDGEALLVMPVHTSY